MGIKKLRVGKCGKSEESASSGVEEEVAMWEEAVWDFGCEKGR